MGCGGEHGGRDVAGGRNDGAEAEAGEDERVVGLPDVVTYPVEDDGHERASGRDQGFSSSPGRYPGDHRLAGLIVGRCRYLAPSVMRRVRLRFSSAWAFSRSIFARTCASSLAASSHPAASVIDSKG
jgi:hypothetical protein